MRWWVALELTLFAAVAFALGGAAAGGLEAGADAARLNGLGLGLGGRAGAGARPGVEPLDRTHRLDELRCARLAVVLDRAALSRREGLRAAHLLGDRDRAALLGVGVEELLGRVVGDQVGADRLVAGLGLGLVVR